MPLYELTRDAVTALHETTFSSQAIAERSDLQRLLKQHVDVIAPDTLVIAEEFCEWEDSKRRIDLLALDRGANIVVIELKRTEDGGHMDLQAIRYAAMVSAMSFSKAVEVFARYLEQNARTEDAAATILQFLNWEVGKEEIFGKNVRIVLVSAEFSKEITTSVLWLNDRDLDIRCVRLKPYILDSRVLLDVQQIVPLPEADSYTIQLKKKAEENKKARQFEPDFTKYDLTVVGKTQRSLTKRALVYAVVKAAIAQGISPDQIAALIPPTKWLSIEGALDTAEFRDKASKLQAKLGGAYDLTRYFCEDGELFQAGGKTYALSNQWSINSLPIVNELIAMLPIGTVAYSKAVPD